LYLRHPREVVGMSNLEAVWMEGTIYGLPNPLKFTVRFFATKTTGWVGIQAGPFLFGARPISGVNC